MKNTPSTVAVDLLSMGYEVYVEHDRPYDITGVLPGGNTVCLIFAVGHKEGDGPLASGFARCRPEDEWNRELGANIAFSRALDQLAWQNAQHTPLLQGKASEQAAVMHWIENEVEFGAAKTRSAK